VQQVLVASFLSCEVGTGFSAKLSKNWRPRTPIASLSVCLTEDYESGFQMHRLGVPIFVPVHGGERGFVATREYFPRKFSGGGAPGTRWITGISLHPGSARWRDTATQLYWFWRDRKGLIGNLAAPFDVLFSMERSPGFGVMVWVAWGLAHSGGQSRICGTLSSHARITAFSHEHPGVLQCAYLWTGFALGVPVRAIWGNWINGFATVMAYYVFLRSRRGQPLSG